MTKMNKLRCKPKMWQSWSGCNQSGVSKVEGDMYIVLNSGCKNRRL